MAITKTEFNNLSLNQKGEYVFKKAKYIGVRKYYNHFINLYEIDNLFFEVWYFPVDNEIKKIEILEKIKTLDLYIDSMNKIE